MSKTPWQKTFDPNFIGAWSLEDGEVFNTVVLKCELKEITSNGKEFKERIVATLKDAPRNGILLPMVIGNKDNAKALQKLSGSQYVEDWKNIPVSIYVKKNIKAFGELVDALRIKDTPPLTGDKKALSEIKALVRDAFKKYEADDRNDVSTELNTNIENIDIKFWEGHLEKLDPKSHAAYMADKKKPVK